MADDDKPKRARGPAIVPTTEADDDQDQSQGPVKLDPPLAPAYPGEPMYNLDAANYGDQSNTTAVNPNPGPTQVDARAVGPAIVPTTDPSEASIPSDNSDAILPPETDQNSEMVPESVDRTPMPASQPQKDQGPAPIFDPLTPDPTVEQLNARDMNFYQDVKQGRVPRSVQELYNQESGLGKIGTLFGLLVGGAGSGLSGQPNIVLDMMQKQVDGGIQQQQRDTSNQQNWLKLYQQHIVDQSNIERNNALNALTLGQAAHIPFTSKEAQANTDKLRADTEGIAGATNAKYIGMLQYIQDQIDTYPEGSPERARAQMVKDTTVDPHFIKAGQKNNADAVGKYILGKALGNAQQQQKSSQPQQQPNSQISYPDNGIDYKRLKILKSNGQFNASNGMPADLLPQDFNKVENELGKVANARSFATQYKKNFLQLYGAPGNDKTFPSRRKALISSVIPQITAIAQQVGHSPQDFASSLFPEWDDIGKTREIKLEQGLNMIRNSEAGSAPTAHYLKLIKPYSDYDIKSTAKDGRPAIFKDGKWQYNDGKSKK